MSIAVSLEDLPGHVAQRGPGYLLTARTGGRPHVVHVRFALVDGTMQAEVGRSTVANIGAVPAVTVLWPPLHDGDYSLIVDAEGRIDGDATAVLTPTSAILHRPA